jgi:hypothetical protein
LISSEQLTILGAMAKGSTVKTKTVAGERPVARTGRSARSEAPTAGEQVEVEQPKAAAPKATKVAAAKKTTTTAPMAVAAISQQPDAQAVAQRAYEIFEREGRPHGRDVEHWLRAEAELSSVAHA